MSTSMTGRNIPFETHPQISVRVFAEDNPAQVDAAEEGAAIGAFRRALECALEVDPYGKPLWTWSQSKYIHNNVDRAYVEHILSFEVSTDDILERGNLHAERRRLVTAAMTSELERLLER